MSRATMVTARRSRLHRIYYDCVDPADVGTRAKVRAYTPRAGGRVGANLRGQMNHATTHGALLYLAAGDSHLGNMRLVVTGPAETAPGWYLGGAALRTWVATHLPFSFELAAGVMAAQPVDSDIYERAAVGLGRRLAIAYGQVDLERRAP